MKLTDSIFNIKNIGEQRLKLFNKLNIFTIKDLIEHLPRAYEDRSNIKPIDELIIDDLNVFIGTIKKEAEVLTINNKTITKLIIKDETGEVNLTWFNMPYLKKYFQVSQQYIFYGKLVLKFGRLFIENPDYEWMKDKELLNIGKIVPIYSLTSKLSQKIFRKIMRDCILNFKDHYEEVLPLSILQKFNLKDKNFAIQNIHFPKTSDDFFEARKRLVFEELFFLQLSLIKLKQYNNNKSTGLIFDNCSYDRVLNLTKFKLTDAQFKVIDQIQNDYTKGILMNRLIQGDVGSGKTIVSVVAAYIAINNGYQCAIMAPTEVLATQHYNLFCYYFDKLNITTCFLSGSQKKKEKTLALQQIKDGSCKMIVGTHALIQESVVFNNLGLVITDEQHRFGVKQREVFKNKGTSVHTIVMTATPIPRTLALILYGDLDISTIDKLPEGRQKVDTFHVGTSYRQRIYAFIQKEVANKRQCYIICPMIESKESNESNEKLDLKDVISYTENLKAKLPNINIQNVHGKMKQADKNAIMSDFSNGDIDVIVATTVIEVGVNVPNATLMIIENAERFGLSQLHQLRGRVGRGSCKSYCIMISDSKNKVTLDRLKAMTNSNDGFYISELDLKLRGSGDFFGTRQHGLPEFKIANLYKDMDLLIEIQNLLQDSDFLQLAFDKNIQKYIFDNYTFLDNNILL